MRRSIRRYRVSIRDDCGFCSAEARLCLRVCLQEVMKTARLPGRIDVSILTETEIRAVNREQRGLDKPTDVLSFPTVDWESGESPLPDPDSGRVFWGDILISAERAAAQAEEYGHSPARELGFLGVHGGFHLLGYDHQTEEERTAMRLREEAVLRKLGLNR